MVRAEQTQTLLPEVEQVWVRIGRVIRVRPEVDEHAGGDHERHDEVPDAPRAKDPARDGAPVRCRKSSWRRCGRCAVLGWSHPSEEGVREVLVVRRALVPWRRRRWKGSNWLLRRLGSGRVRLRGWGQQRLRLGPEGFGRWAVGRREERS